VKRHALNDGWSVRPKANRWSDLMGDTQEWVEVTLPHDAVIGTTRDPSAGPATGYFPGGVWEYRRTLDLAADDAGTAIALEFEGVYRDANVWVNGTAAAHRPYGYSNFNVAIDHLLHVGDDNELLVVASAHDDSRWYSGAGIHRAVWLLQGARLHLTPDGTVVRTPEVDDDGATVTVAAEVRSRSRLSEVANLQIEVLDGGGAVVATDAAPLTILAGDTVRTQRRLFVARPQRWSPDDPNLYTVRLTLSVGDEVLDEEAIPFGIRSLALDARRGLRINGEPVLLRGACIHHDNGVLGAATINRAEERRVELLKAAGFNAIRSAHNPASRALLDACDRLGMLVMDETFDMWTQTKSDDDYALRFPDWWEADVEAMVRRDVNHPSVVMYSIGNEITDGSTATGIQVARKLAEKVRALDPTRFVAQGVSGFLVAGPDLLGEFGKFAGEADVDDETGVNTAITNLGDMMVEVMRSPVVGDKTSEAYSHLDVCGYNYMESRFAMDAELFPHRVIAATESHPSRIDGCWTGVTDNANVIGDFTWTGWDYLGEAGIGRVEYGEERNELGMTGFLGVWPYLAAWCGDIDITGHRRPQSYYREIVWGLRTDPYVAVQRPEHHGKLVVHSSPWAWTDVVGSWSWPDHVGKPVTVEVYADGDEVELLLDGRSIGRAPAGREHRYRAEFELTYEPGELVAIARRDGKELGRTALRAADGSVLLEVAADRSEIAADPSDLAYVTITFADADGSLANTADRRVEVAVDGPGVLQGLGSADPATEESFTGRACTTFDGRALAVIRPTGAGTITVTVAADGCDPQTVRIGAR
jgi:beta-galactosidase